ncbi:MAG: DUF885 domain-containing protein, partial [Nitrososphaerales archaeon]
MKKYLSVFVGLLVCYWATTPSWAASDQAHENHATVALHQLFNTAWQREMREHPLEASADGFHEYDGNWPDVSLNSLAKQQLENIQTLKDLAGIDYSQLDHEDQLSYDLFKYRYQIQIQGYNLKDYLMPINQLGGIQTMSTLTHTLRFESAQDYQNYIKRLQTINVFIDQTMDLMKQGVKDGMTEPQVVMQRIPHQIAANVVAKPEQSAFYSPFKNMPSIIPAAEQAQLRADAKTAIANVLVPAYRKFRDYYDKDY